MVEQQPLTLTMSVRLAPPELMEIQRLNIPAPCSDCGGPTWMQDELGAVHPCCRLWADKSTSCPACAASAGLNKNHQSRLDRKLRIK